MLVVGSITEIWTISCFGRIVRWVRFLFFHTISISIDLYTTINIGGRISEHNGLHYQTTIQIINYQLSSSHHQLALAIKLIIPIILATHILDIINFYLIEIAATFIQFQFTTEPVIIVYFGYFRQPFDSMVHVQIATHFHQQLVFQVPQSRHNIPIFFFYELSPIVLTTLSSVRFEVFFVFTIHQVK